jgi:hypothetical protein
LLARARCRRALFVAARGFLGVDDFQFGAGLDEINTGGPLARIIKGGADALELLDDVGLLELFWFFEGLALA